MSEDRAALRERLRELKSAHERKVLDGGESRYWTGRAEGVRDALQLLAALSTPVAQTEPDGWAEWYDEWKKLLAIYAARQIDCAKGFKVSPHDAYIALDAHVRKLIGTPQREPDGWVSQAVAFDMRCYRDVLHEFRVATRPGDFYRVPVYIGTPPVAAGGQTWQPIETAPPFKSVLLWWRTCKEPRLGRYYAAEDGEGWRCDGDQCVPRNQEDCTHWMPLPAAPNTEADHAE